MFGNSYMFDYRIIIIFMFCSLSFLYIIITNLFV